MIGIINYDGGNIGSLCNALEQLGYNFQLLDTADAFWRVEKIIMPGQGRAGTAFATLSEQELLGAISKTVKPFLGICLGMQLLYESLAEDNTPGLGIFAGEVSLFSNSLPRPQMGWNNITVSKPSRILDGIPENSNFYFANSYYAPSSKNQDLATYQYDAVGAAVVKKNNFYGLQFHPEKSGSSGFQILKNFIELC